MEVIRNAAPLDVETATLWERIQREFYANQRAIVESLHARAALASGLDVTHATDILWTLNHPDVWALLVRERGWTPAQYERWLGEASCSQLLGSARDPGRGDRRRGRRARVGANLDGGGLRRRVLRARLRPGWALAPRLRVAAPDHAARHDVLRRLSDAAELPALPEPRPGARLPAGLRRALRARRPHPLRPGGQQGDSARHRLARAHRRGSRRGVRRPGGGERPPLGCAASRLRRRLQRPCTALRRVPQRRRHPGRPGARGGRRQLRLRPRRRCRDGAQDHVPLDATRPGVPAEDVLRPLAQRSAGAAAPAGLALRARLAHAGTRLGRRRATTTRASRRLRHPT